MTTRPLYSFESMFDTSPQAGGIRELCFLNHSQPTSVSTAGGEREEFSFPTSEILAATLLQIRCQMEMMGRVLIDRGTNKPCA
jgi:hypothetical protein